MTARKLVVGNWKMNPSSLDEAKRIASRTRTVASRLEHTEVIACPPFPFISTCSFRRTSPQFRIGAQSVAVEEGGPHTGEVSGAMLRSLGVEYVIVGHSEERARGDRDGVVAKRAMRALESSLVTILCVGEKAREENGSHFDFVKNQVKDSLAGIPANRAKNIVIAYEPVWAIGAAEPMKAEEIYEMSLFVKKAFADVFGSEAGLKVKVLYGGAVNFRNAREIITIGKVDGLLVGRESVNMPGFVELLRAVDDIGK